MAANSGFMIAEAERRFPIRVRIGVPPDGLGPRLDRIKAWLDENAGANGWAMTPSGTRGVLNDALSIYFGDPTLATAFVAPVVCRLSDRDHWRRLPGARGRAHATSRGLAASDTVERM
jgi:hypothetical protein